LQIYNLQNVFARENVMASADTLRESEVLQHGAYVRKLDVRKPRAAQKPISRFVVFSHPTFFL